MGFRGKLNLGLEKKDLFEKGEMTSSLVLHWVKDLALSLLWLKFSCGLGNFNLLQAQLKTLTKNKKQEMR